MKKCPNFWYFRVFLSLSIYSFISICVSLSVSVPPPSSFSCSPSVSVSASLPPSIYLSIYLYLSSSLCVLFLVNIIKIIFNILIWKNIMERLTLIRAIFQAYVNSCNRFRKMSLEPHSSNRTLEGEQRT